MRKRVTLSSVAAQAQRPVYDRAPVTRQRIDQRAMQTVEQKGVRGERIPPRGGSLPYPLTPDKEVREVEKVADLVKQASLLSKVEQQELLDHLALQNQLTAKANQSRDLDMWATAVGMALDETVGGSDGGSYGSMLVKRLLGSTSCWRPVEAFMVSSKLQELRVVERQAVYMLLARLLVDHAGYVARKSGAPLGPKLVGQCTGSLPGVFEQSFPGYLAAGLAPVIARQMGALAG